MSDADGRVVLVDRDGRELAGADGEPLTMAKLEAHQRGELHRAVSVFVFDGEKLLLQKRAAKYHSSGLWANTCCTHTLADESQGQAASRRLWQEMGVRCDLSEAFAFTYRVQVPPDLVEHEYDHVFIGDWRGTPAPDPGEVADWRWETMDGIESELAAAPERFAPWFEICYRRVMAERDRLRAGL